MSVDPRATVTTGRTVGRGHTLWLCKSCNQRVMIGEPAANATWPARLSLSPKQVDLLLTAAAEFRDMCDEAGEYADAVSFVDWVRPDALSRTYGSPVSLRTERR